VKLKGGARVRRAGKGENEDHPSSTPPGVFKDIMGGEMERNW